MSKKESLRGQRSEARVTTRDVGRPLHETKTLREFLHVMYDACVAQRNLYRKCGIFHREINDYNILIAPDGPRFDTQRDGRHHQVKYLNQILKPNEPPRPACMIIDFGNNIEQGIDINVPRVLHERRGLPKFIARSIFKRRILYPTAYMFNGVTIPRLYGRSLEIYATADNAEYEQFNQSVDQNPPHSSDPPEPNFAYRLFHDAESTFWVIASFLAYAAPKEYQIETEWNRNFHIFVTGTSLDWLEIHKWDPRAVFWPDRKFWQDILHPSFSTVAPMLGQMHRYIHPEWAYRPEINPEHVHEALMRLLLTEIVRIQDNDADIEFATEIRALPIPEP